MLPKLLMMTVLLTLLVASCRPAGKRVPLTRSTPPPLATSTTLAPETTTTATPTPATTSPPPTTPPVRPAKASPPAPRTFTCDQAAALTTQLVGVPAECGAAEPGIIAETDFYTDGSVKVVYRRPVIACQSVAHETAHVLAGSAAGHGPAWLASYRHQLQSVCHQL